MIYDTKIERPVPTEDSLQTIKAMDLVSKTKLQINLMQKYLKEVKTIVGLDGAKSPLSTKLGLDLKELETIYNKMSAIVTTHSNLKVDLF